jgi:hypothetical protein
LPLVVVGAVPVLPPPKLQALSKNAKRRLQTLSEILKREKKDGEP